MPVVIRVNKSLCIGCASCVQIAPQIFKLENGTSVVREKFRIEDTVESSTGKIDDELLELIEKAAQYCPLNAIEYIEVK